MMQSENSIDDSEGGMRTQWSRLFLLVGVGMAAAFQIGKAPPVLPLLRMDLGLSLFMAGWVLSAFNVTGAIMSPGAGAITDWLGHRRLLLSGLACMALSSMAGSYAPNATFLLLTRFFEGLGYVFVIVSVPGLILKVVHHKDMRIAFGVWSAFMPAGGATMMILAPVLVAGFGWRGMWRINAGLLFAFMIWLAWATRHLPGDDTRGKTPGHHLLHDIRVTVMSPGPVLIALCFGSYAFQFLVVFGFLPTLLIEVQGLKQGMAAVLSAIALASSVPGNLLGGWLLQRKVKGWILIAAGSMTMGLCSFGIFSGGASLLFRYAACVVFMCIGGIIPAVLIHGSVAYAPSPDLVSTSNGLMFQGAQIGLLAGPPLVAAVVSRQGHWQSAPWIMAAVALIGVVLSLGLRSIEKRRPEGTAGTKEKISG
jgi:predicted MFS family arabinose efflux permease